MTITGELFEQYVAIVRRLRKDCPWDREQTHESIRQHLIEETYEVIEAIDHRNADHLKAELGDLLLHVTLHTAMAEETSSFTMDDVLTEAADKMIRRHPHVFGNETVATAEEVRHQWERNKLKEGRTSILDGVPRELPSLLRAERLQEKASKVGFDWENAGDVWSKVEEEVRELHRSVLTGSQAKTEEEFGDLLFALVNYARFIGVQPETALRRATVKFTRRFQLIEAELAKRGKTVNDSTLKEMDEIWDEMKRRESDSTL